MPVAGKMTVCALPIGQELLAYDQQRLLLVHLTYSNPGPTISISQEKKHTDFQDWNL
jgi:hypothetical protein